ncbi:EAL domain-containing protein [Ectothiorhodospiraceae bacterium 2226]|nr:EAL domain-containing protein [Ectothiorhodospiraceae bacterium 2226]
MTAVEQADGQVGLPVRITVIVFWVLVLTGVLVSTVLLNNAERHLLERYDTNADRAAFAVSQWLGSHPDAQLGELAPLLEDEIGRLSLAGLEVSRGEESLGIGERGATLTLAVRQIPRAERPMLELRVFQPPAQKAIGEQRKRLLLGMAFSLLVFGLGLVWILRRVLSAPFQAMVDTARAISAGSGEVRFDTARRDEFGYLAGFMNRMLDQMRLHQKELSDALDQVRRSQAELFAEKERAEVTLDAIADAVVRTDVAGRVEFLNPVAQEILGVSVEQVVGRDLDDVMRVVNEHTGDPQPSAVKQCMRDGAPLRRAEETLLVCADGREVHISMVAAPIRNASGAAVGAAMVFRDVGRARELARQLTYQASHDGLTGLLNRQSFERALRQAVDEARNGQQHHALCYLDLDQFKLVNDTCGHVAGDELLRQIAQLIREHLRESDIIARLGGDEFGLLLRGCALSDAERVADKVCRAIRAFRFVWKDHSFLNGASIGLVPIVEDSGTVAELLSLADVACYAAKDSGRNKVHVYTPDDAQLGERRGEMRRVPAIRKAIDEDRFVLHAQPIAALDPDRAGHSPHVEVLVRMLDEEGATVPPMAFIPAAERYDLMPEIDRWVIRSTFSMIEGGRPDGLVCAINVSGASICDDDFLDFVLTELERSGVDPEGICFEITETAAVANLSRARRAITVLRGVGCCFSLDDFGSGLSSFAYLRDLPVNYLKIDGSFVADIVSDPIHRAMVRSINEVGHIMGLRTIAEFAENDAVIAALREIGVDYAQGYGIARPCPLNQLLVELRSSGKERALQGM